MSYIDTYDTLAERNQANPATSNRHVEILSENFARAIGDITGKDVCDVGSGRGYLIQNFKKSKPRSVTAIDIAAPSLSDVVNRHQVDGYLANAEHLPFQDHFDVIAATDIIEHVLNVSNFLVTANWALRDGGLLAARVPYLEDFLYYSNYHGLPVHYTHIRTFDKKTFVELIESFGFKVEKVMYDGFDPNYPNQFVALFPKLRDFVHKKLREQFGGDDAVTRINPWIGRLLMKPIEIGVVARKVKTMVPVDAHTSFRQFHEARQKTNEEFTANIAEKV
ncbi:MAG: methyltransferase domain-containing protein [Alphaproteobacteria bacterium]|nr:methyltransferase domain-containing protein [Alphaproteobacteria bacterium]